MEICQLGFVKQVLNIIEYHQLKLIRGGQLCLKKKKEVPFLSFFM